MVHRAGKNGEKTFPQKTILRDSWKTISTVSRITEPLLLYESMKKKAFGFENWEKLKSGRNVAWRIVIGRYAS